MARLRISLVAGASLAVLACASRASADAPIGMMGGEARLSLLTRSRNLALSDGPHVPGGTFGTLDMVAHYSFIDMLRDDRGAFRAGDYLAGGLGVGYGSADNGNAADKFYYSLPLRFGLQTAMRFDRNLDVGLRGYYELRLEPFWFVGWNAEAWARVNAIYAKVNYGWFSNQRVESQGPIGYKSKTLDLVGGLMVNDQLMLGAGIDWLNGKDLDGSVTQWRFSAVIGLMPKS